MDKFIFYSLVVAQVLIVGGLIYLGFVALTAEAKENKETSLFVTEVVNFDHTWRSFTKIYDATSKVMCYTLEGGSSGASISCVKL